MSNFPVFTWRHFEADIIFCAVRWYLRDALSYRDVEELMQERVAEYERPLIAERMRRGRQMKLRAGVL